MIELKKAKTNQRIYLFSGIFLILVGIYVNFRPIVNGEFSEAIMILALGINQLLFSYLSPHIFPRDERGKGIIGKAMTVNYFILFLVIGILFIATSPGTLGFLHLTASQVLVILFSIMAISIPSTMIVYTKIL